MDVVVCAADAPERALLATVIQQAGVTSIVAATIEDLVKCWSDYAADGILLADHGDLTGLVHRVRTVASVLLIVITDALSEAQQAALYDAGASLVLPRPYSARLLVSQLRALLQLSRGALPARADLQVDDLTLDLATCTARRAEHALPRLTALECRLLHVLLLHRGQTLPAETLIERVWGYTEGDRTLLRKLVNRLRAKIEPDPRQPRYTITVPGIGYSFLPNGWCAG